MDDAHYDRVFYLADNNGLSTEDKLGGFMSIDEEKIDETALAMLYLTLHDHCRAWKQLDWDITNRLHQKGMIESPTGKSKSVVFTPEGLAKSEELFKKLFVKL